MKFRFSFFWIGYLVLAYLSHVMKTFLIIFLMLFIHEMAHVLMAKYFHYDVSEIIITPFGFVAQIHHLDHGNILSRIFILLAGLSMHLLYPFIFYGMYKMQLLSTMYMDYLNQINRSILVFNLLPIYPLDGGRILLCCLQLFMKYKISRMIVLSLSCFMLWIMFCVSTWNMRFLFIFLGIILMIEIQKNKMDYVEYCYNQRKYLKLHKNHV